MIRGFVATASRCRAGALAAASSTVSMNEDSKNALKIVRFSVPEFTPEIANSLKKKVVSPIDALPENIDRDLVVKFPNLLKVLNKEMLPQELPTYNERIAYYLATYNKGKASGRRSLKRARREEFAFKVNQIVTAKYESEAPIREALDRQSSTRAVKRRLKGLRARFPAPTI